MTPFKLAKAEEIRRRKLLPGGKEPRWIRCYDNGGESADRYTVVFTGRVPGKSPGWFFYLAMSGAPFHPQGVGLHCESQHYPVDAPDGKWPPPLGRKCHLGKRISFFDLPADCKRLVYDDYFDYWDIKGPKPEVK